MKDFKKYVTKDNILKFILIIGMLLVIYCFIKVIPLVSSIIITGMILYIIKKDYPEIIKRKIKI